MSISGLISSALLMSTIPIYAPPTRGSSSSLPVFSDIDCVTFKYLTNGENISKLLPDNLSVEAQPLVTMMFLEYGYTAVGPYKEMIHYVEATYKGKKYDYPIILVLDNEDAVYGGREVLGFPKVMGTLDFTSKSDGNSGFKSGSVMRPSNTPVVEYLFKPTGLMVGNATSQIHSSIPGLNLRIIPSAVRGSPPSVRQFVEVDFRLDGGEVWEGTGSLNFPTTSRFDPLYSFPVVEYKSVVYTRKASGTVSQVKAVHDF